MRAEKDSDKIVLEKFGYLDEEEKIVARKLIDKYVQKIEKIAEYKQLKLLLKEHSRDKVSNYEVIGRLEYKNETFMSSNQDANPFVAIDFVMDKLLKELQKQVKKN